MRIRVVHETIYTYEQPARGLVQVLRLTPRDHDGQYVRTWRIDTTIDGRLTAREDGFGNVVHWFTPDEPADALTIRVTGEVDTDDTNGVVRGTVERLPDQFFLRDTDLCAASPELHAFAERVAAEGDGAVLALLHRLMGAVRGAVTYEPGPASSAVPAAKAFAAGSGVCQDLAHVFLAAARHIGIPARYVAGYRARDDGQADVEAPHGWVEALVPDLGWVAFDPCYDVSPSDNYIRVATGLDYLGAAPIRGSRTGGGTETLDVKLRVEQGRTAAQS
ncbi:MULTISPECIES: transglutaminase family protein [Methylobacterium]|jgi:transglutaminase-like putative cysteine protease|uniref:Transglutaminase n=1 Tax=Methylobacterium phyllosphaerae TaxID=418223 RepID=A0AAE8L6A2_9HYPH|nr:MULTISPECIES: transglutaminase family protein [Methylobacterium]KOX51634.1 transglutaminase [Streptomyces purpurogeneiscleroticus]APT29454.1 transglutaminase [Methylobacterium phyllosphaerae]AWV18918.1 transglutaminase [Methylobacterium sp. XJLW]MBP32841.1 transglutaminase family protein [Methylobacterium sp.]MDE4916016.1 transglutaminase family protein [Methylobacterium sp. 092160098-2]